MEKPNSEDNHYEIRSQDNRARVLNAEYEPGEEFEAISAPVYLKNNKPSSGRHTDKISIDSLTELSSPFDEGSSVKALTLQDDEESASRRISVIQTLASGAKSQQVAKQQAEPSSAYKKTMKLQSKRPGQPPQMHGSTNFLQAVSRHNLIATSKQEKTQTQRWTMNKINAS